MSLIGSGPRPIRLQIQLPMQFPIHLPIQAPNLLSRLS